MDNDLKRDGDLVERLRAADAILRHGNYNLPCIEEAAAEIENLRHDIVRLIAANSELATANVK